MLEVEFTEHLNKSQKHVCTCFICQEGLCAYHSFLWTLSEWHHLRPCEWEQERLFCLYITEINWREWETYSSLKLFSYFSCFQWCFCGLLDMDIMFQQEQDETCSCCDGCEREKAHINPNMTLMAWWLLIIMSFLEALHLSMQTSWSW